MFTEHGIHGTISRTSQYLAYHAQPQWLQPVRREAEPLLSPLTPKETHLLRLLAKGYSNQALAANLCVTLSTVRTHLRNIYAKLGATSRTQAVAMGHRKGLICDSDMAGATRESDTGPIAEFQAGSTRPQLCDAMAHLSESNSFARFMQRLEHGYRAQSPAHTGDGVCGSSLTAKEVRLLRLLAEGHSNKVLADKVFVSQSTVRTHLRHIYAKLGASNRTQTVALGRQYGLIG